MNSISLTSYNLNIKDYVKLYCLLEKNGFEITGLNSPGIVKDKEERNPNYAIILNHRKVILLDERSEQNQRYRERHNKLKEILDEF